MPSSSATLVGEALLQVLLDLHYASFVEVSFLISSLTMLHLCYHL